MKQMDDLEVLLGETGELEEVRAMAAKKILAADIRRMMDQRGISKAQLAKSMHTARPVVDRLLDQVIEAITRLVRDPFAGSKDEGYFFMLQLR